MLRELFIAFCVATLALIIIAAPLYLASKDAEKKYAEEKAKQKTVHYKYEYRTDSGTRIGKICLDVYKFIVSKGPGAFDKEVIKQSFVYKDGVSVPEKCSDENIKYKDAAPMPSVM